MKRFAGTILGVTLLAAPAFAGLFEDVYSGLRVLSTPTGFPTNTLQDGTRVNGQRLGRLRLVPHDLSNGYTLEFDRNFGQDLAGRPEVFDLGPVELELSGGTSMTAGFSRRGFLIGSLDFSTNNLNYQLRANSGAANTELSGQLLTSGSMEINQFGFYTLELQMDNTQSELRVNGVVDEDFEPTNFSVGPISLQGNIFIDMLAAGLAQAGVDTSGLQALFPRSPISVLTDSILQGGAGNSAVAGLFLENDKSNVAPALLLDPLPTAPDLSAGPRFESDPSVTNLPEPSSAAALLALGVAGLTRRSIRPVLGR
jgi:hypothetical protein